MFAKKAASMNNLCPTLELPLHIPPIREKVVGQTFPGLENRFCRSVSSLAHNSASSSGVRGLQQAKSQSRMFIMHKMTLLGDCAALERGERAATDGHVSGKNEGKGARTRKRISCYLWSAVNKTW